MNFLQKLFSRPNYQELLNRGAKIIDVRSQEEFNNGHLQKSINIPLQDIANQTEIIRQFGTPIITCCASGVRSKKAVSILSKHNLEAYNGGSWKFLKKYC